MDPISAIGAVASIITLAQTAIALSTTLYGLGGALLSASEDLKSLADDLKTFSQSLTLLSRLLEDSKSWYSDDIYLLMAKVIKDCADLYVKIDGVLSKLGGKGKTSWMKRMKFVMKESQIRNLLNRLRDLKGTLATILMSLQVDLQLSLLNISSSSKLQRAPEAPLQPGTVKTLIEAQESVQRTRLLSIQGRKSESCVQIQVEEKRSEIRPIDSESSPAAMQMYGSSIFMFQKASNIDNTVPNAEPFPRAARNLKSASSSKSFKSALDEQEPDIEIVREVEGVLHAFRTALEVLQKAMRRIDEEDKGLRVEADMLNLSLTNGLKIEQTHRSHHKQHGHAYLNAFRESSSTPNQLREVTAKIMGELVTALHMYSAAHEVLSRKIFRKLYGCAEECRIKALFELDRIAVLLYPEPITLILRTSAPWGKVEHVPLRGSRYEIYVTEHQVNQRFSADYDRLLHSVQSVPFRGRSEASSARRRASSTKWTEFSSFTSGMELFSDDSGDLRPDDWNFASTSGFRSPELKGSSRPMVMDLEKELNQFQFAKRIEWKPPLSVVEAKNRGNADVGEVVAPTWNSEAEPERESQQYPVLPKQDEELDDLFQKVKELRRQAEKIGRELEEQNRVLEAVNLSADHIREGSKTEERGTIKHLPLLRVSRPVAACLLCRAAKIKCDGKLPACTPCKKQGCEIECSSSKDEFTKGKERRFDEQALLQESGEGTNTWMDMSSFYTTSDITDPPPYRGQPLPNSLVELAAQYERRFVLGTRRLGDPPSTASANVMRIDADFPSSRGGRLAKIALQKASPKTRSPVSEARSPARPFPIAEAQERKVEREEYETDQKVGLASYLRQRQTRRGSDYNDDWGVGPEVADDKESIDLTRENIRERIARRDSNDAEEETYRLKPRLASTPIAVKKLEETKPRGILRLPRGKFPEDPVPIREGVAPLKNAKEGAPPDARWTKISRRMVSPQVLEAGNERYEAREEFLIVLRVLSKEEIQAYAAATQRIRAAREMEELEEREEYRRRRRERRERGYRERDRREPENLRRASSMAPTQNRSHNIRHRTRSVDLEKRTRIANSSAHSELTRHLWGFPAEAGTGLKARRMSLKPLVDSVQGAAQSVLPSNTEQGGTDRGEITISPTDVEFGQAKADSGSDPESTEQKFSGLASPSTGQKNIHFNEQVEQCIALEMKGEDDEEADSYAINDEYDSSSDDGAIMMERTNSNRKFPTSRKNTYLEEEIVTKTTRSGSAKGDFGQGSYGPPILPPFDASLGNIPTRLWSQAHTAAYNLEADFMPSLVSAWGSGLGIDARYLVDSVPTWLHSAAKEILRVLNTLGPVENSVAELEDAKSYRENIIKVIEAVSGTLGLDSSLLAWGSTAVVLKMYESFFKSFPSEKLEISHEKDFESVNKTFSQLSDIVSIIARYAVMENLYSQTPTMTLRLDYKAALVDLCVKILHWFSNTFTLAKSLEDNSSESSTQKELSVTFWEEIKKMDLACQKFNVVVEAMEEVIDIEKSDEETNESGSIELHSKEISTQYPDEIMGPKEEQDKNATDKTEAERQTQT